MHHHTRRRHAPFTSDYITISIFSSLPTLKYHFDGCVGVLGLLAAVCVCVRVYVQPYCTHRRFTCGGARKLFAFISTHTHTQWSGVEFSRSFACNPPEQLRRLSRAMWRACHRETRNSISQAFTHAPTHTYRYLKATWRSFLCLGVCVCCFS